MSYKCNSFKSNCSSEDEFATDPLRCAGDDTSVEEEEEGEEDDDDDDRALVPRVDFYRHGDFVRVLLACYTKTFEKKMRAGICVFWEKGHPQNRAWALTAEEKLTRAQVQVLGKVIAMVVDTSGYPFLCVFVSNLNPISF